MLAALLLHELPDGRVEVGLDAVAYPDKLEIAYQVDISDGSMRDQLASDDAVSDSDELLDNYRQQALKDIGDNLIVRVGGKEQVVRPVSSELGPRHPVRFICYYEADLRGLEQAPGPLEFELQDQSYADFEKEFRCALHGKDGAEVVESNVADLLIRAEPRELWKSPAAERAALQTIRAKISLPGSATGATGADNRTKVDTNADEGAENNRRPFFRIWYAFALLAAIVVAFLIVGRGRR